MIDIRRIDWKILIICLIVTLATGAVSGIISGNSMIIYEGLNLPSLYPPGMIFPIVWTVLYILMGISLYIIIKAREPGDYVPLIVFGLQLAANFLWAPIFFVLELYLVAFILLLAIWVLVLAMIAVFWRIDRTAAGLQIPYIIWLTFAAYLSYGVYMLN